MIIVDIDQQSPEWFIEKAGKISASDFNQVITSKGIPSKSQDKYARQLAGETIKGYRDESYQSYEMKQGIKYELEVRAYFEMLHGECQQVGMIYKDESKRVSCSPDGLYPDEGFGIEIKWKKLEGMVEILESNKPPITDYFYQYNGCMYVTGFKYWYVIFYHPGLKPSITKVERDDFYCEKLDIELPKFISKIDYLISKIK